MEATRTILTIIAWALLALFIAFLGTLMHWSFLAVILVGYPPIAKIVVMMLIAAVMIAVLAWLLVRYVMPFRIVALGGISLLVLVLLVQTAAALAMPDDALFLARSVGWGDSDVWDYQKFPERVINNAPPVFNFRQQPSPQLFNAIHYTVDGQPQQQNLDELIASTDTTSLIVIKDGTILYEGYANGYDRDSIVTSFSTAKSVTSALIGIAIDEGYIDSVDDPIIKYLPEMSGRGYDQMTIRDVLLMSSGIRFVPQDAKSALGEISPFHDEALSYYYPDLRRLALELPASEEPVGAVFNYNQYHPLLLGLILERTTQRPVTQYMEEKLWKPLGMEFPATWSLDSDKDSFEKMESGINGRAIDFAKFGVLFLNDGKWDGKQLISPGWVKESTAPDPTDTRPFEVDQDWKDAGGYYKYMWWGQTRKNGSYIYFAHGHLGQNIAVSPRDRAVVVRFGISDGLDSWDEVCEELIARTR